MATPGTKRPRTPSAKTPVDGAGGPQSWLVPCIPVLSGAGAGAICSVLCSPLDVAKIRVQVQDVVLPPGRPRKYGGVVPTLRTIWAEEGVLGWYKGLTPAMICIPIFWGIYFHVYETAKAAFRRQTGDEHHLLSAISAGAVTDVVTNPFWVVRTRMQTQVLHVLEEGGRGVSMSMVETFRHVWATEGIRAFYRGLTASLLGLSHVAIQFPVYERLKAVARERNNGGGERPSDLILASAASKVVGSCVTYPHEVLRARMQDERARPRSRPKGLVSTFQSVVRLGGYRALYTGFQLNMFRVVPSCVATFLSYEIISRELRARLGPKGGDLAAVAPDRETLGRTKTSANAEF